MSQVVSEDAVGDQLLDVADALVARSLELLERQLRLAIGVVELLGAAPRIPLRLEGGQHARDLVEVDAVGARVGARIRSDLEPAARNHVGDDRGDIADAVIVRGLADIECLIEDQVLRRFERRDEGARDVFDVDDRPPGRSIGLQIDETLW